MKRRGSNGRFVRRYTGGRPCRPSRGDVWRDSAPRDPRNLVVIDIVDDRVVCLAIPFVQPARQRFRTVYFPLATFGAPRHVRVAAA